jgi:hypothetical protein
METDISAPTSSAASPSSVLFPHLDRRSTPSRFLKLLAFCLTTSGLLAIAPTPAQAIESQMEAEAALHLVCVKEAEQFICKPDRATAQESDMAPQPFENSIRATATIEPLFLSPSQQSMLSNWLLGLAYLLPVGLGLCLFLSDRYANYRSAIIKHQVEALERIWQRAQHEKG